MTQTTLQQQARELLEAEAASVWNWKQRVLAFLRRLADAPADARPGDAEFVERIDAIGRRPDYASLPANSAGTTVYGWAILADNLLRDLRARLAPKEDRHG